MTSARTAAASKHGDTVRRLLPIGGIPLIWLRVSLLGPSPSNGQTLALAEVEVLHYDNETDINPAAFGRAGRMHRRDYCARNSATAGGNRRRHKSRVRCDQLAASIERDAPPERGRRPRLDPPRKAAPLLRPRPLAAGLGGGPPSPGASPFKWRRTVS